MSKCPQGLQHKKKNVRKRKKCKIQEEKNQIIKNLKDIKIALYLCFNQQIEL